MDFLKFLIIIFLIQQHLSQSKYLNLYKLIYNDDQYIN
jgi:hypothetical protein